MQIIWRLRVRNLRLGTVATNVQVALAISTTDGELVWEGMAHWRHQNAGLFAGLGEMDIAASKWNRRSIDVIYQMADDRVQVRESDEGRLLYIPIMADQPMSIVVTAFANNVRKDVETHWAFQKEGGLCAVKVS